MAVVHPEVCDERYNPKCVNQSEKPGPYSRMVHMPEGHTGEWWGSYFKCARHSDGTLQMMLTGPTSL